MEKANPQNKKFLKEIASGTSSLILLKIVEQAKEAMYGYQIVKVVNSFLNGQDSIIKQGAIYPVLRSLEKLGLFSSEVEPSISGPPRRYYSITEEGKSTLKDWIKIWENNERFVNTVLIGVNDGK